MTLTLLGAACGLIACLLTAVILVHAFGRSVGTGVIVLCVPAYIVFYAFSQFDHPRKHLLVPAWLCALLLAGVLLPLGTHGLPQPSPLRALGP